MSGNHRARIAVAIALAWVAAAAQADPVYTAQLDGAQNLPEPVTTAAKGTIELALSADRKSVAYKVYVEKLSNPSAADVHLGAASQNGPLVVKLWPKGTAAPRKGEVSGLLASGTFDAGDLVGPMTGATVAELIEELEAGNLYVNVHTHDGVDPPNSGPGDYRLGEIRGHVR